MDEKIVTPSQPDHHNDCTHSTAEMCLDAAQQAFADFKYEQVVALCEQALSLTNEVTICAEIRCLLAEALEYLAHYNKAVDALIAYENKAVLNALPQFLQCRILYRLSAAYGGTMDILKAISQSRAALQHAQQQGATEIEQQCSILMSVLFRKLGELQLARTYLEPILASAQHVTPAIVAQANNSLGIILTLEGKWDEARQALISAIDAVSAQDAPLLRGSLDVNLAAVVSLQGKMREGKVLLERALPQLQRAGNPRLIVNARSNLGFNLLRLGEIEPAKKTLSAALAEARASDLNLIVASTLESLAECHSIQGNFSEAENYFQQSLAILNELGVSFNKVYALLSYGRHLLLQNDIAGAQKTFTESLAIAQQSSDPRGQAAAELFLLETFLLQGNYEIAQTRFALLKQKVERLGSLNVLGHLWEVAGLLAQHEKNFQESIRLFKQAVSIWEVVEEPYRCARAHYKIGLNYNAKGMSEDAQKYLRWAQATFQRLSAAPMLAHTEKALQQTVVLTLQTTPPLDFATKLVQCLKSLAETAANPELALREFTRMLREDFAAAPVIIFRQDEEKNLVAIASQECDARQINTIAERIKNDSLNLNEFSQHFSSTENQRFWLYLKRNTSDLTDAILELFAWHLRAILDAYSALNTHKEIDPFPAHQALLPMPGLIYCSHAMRHIVEQAHRLSQSNINVLITGESGTGKELVAHGVHLLSQRANKAFVPFNCAAAPRELLESQIFGHRRGAFTGASNSFSGVIGAAANGTLFLDEIGDFALDMQPKLLRFIQSGEVQKVGEATPSFVDVRLIAATNCELEKMVEEGRFRADLYYRLNVIRFHLPPLRERREEISLLTNHFLQHYSTQMQKTDISLMPSTLALLEQHDWPGNARELESEIHRVVALVTSGAVIAPHHLSSKINKSTNTFATNPVPTIAPLDAANKTLAQIMDETQQSIISNALEKHAWNISRAAKELGISRFSLRNMMKRFNLITT